MSDTKTGDEKTLSVTPKKMLTLKRPGSSGNGWVFAAVSGSGKERRP